MITKCDKCEKAKGENLIMRNKISQTLIKELKGTKVTGT